MDLIVIGVVDIDTVLRTSLKAGVINPVTEYKERFSGSALTIAVDSSILKAEAGIISPVGRDAVGLLDVLRRHEIDYSHIVLSQEKNPNFIEFYTTKHYSLYYEGALKDLHSENIEKDYLKRAKIVHICFPDRELAENVVKVCKKEKVLTSVDTSFVEADADILFTSSEEKRKGRTTVVTDFENGVLCNGKEIPVFRGGTYYENGVKDAFIAAFLTRYIKSGNAESAAFYGSCAAYLCSRHESSVLTCTKEDLDELFEEKIREAKPGKKTGRSD